MKKWHKELLTIVGIICLLFLFVCWMFQPNYKRYSHNINPARYQQVEKVFDAKLPEGTVIKEIVIFGGRDRQMFVKLTISSDKLDEFCYNTDIDMTKINKKTEGSIKNWWEMESEDFGFDYKEGFTYFVVSKPKDELITILMSHEYS